MKSATESKDAGLKKAEICEEVSGTGRVEPGEEGEIARFNHKPPALLIRFARAGLRNKVE